MMSLEGRTVVVTGAGKGIGRATAVLAAQRGARVIAIARTEQDLKELAEQIGSRSIVADISDAAIALKAAESSMPADHLVNCAGTNIHESFLHTKVESFDAIQALNVRATLIFSQVFARHRITQGGGGAIVNVSSIAAWNGFTNHASYSASKGISAHAADFVWRCGGAIALHAELGYDVTVVCLSFGERGESAKLWKQPGMTLSGSRRPPRESESAAEGAWRA
jgi:short-subunit dehydrogenase